MIRIEPLTHTPLAQIQDCFNKAFADYAIPFQLRIDQLQYLLKRRGGQLDISFGAFAGNQLVAFTLNGMGTWKGVLTAYDTGTGVIPAFRRRGLATRILQESFPVLRARGIEQYLLEVLCGNEKAADLYRKTGFEITRKLDYYIFPQDALDTRQQSTPSGYTISPLQKPDWQQLCAYWDYEPAWQNSIDAINRTVGGFEILGIFHSAQPVGYGIIETATGDIPQLAISPGHRCKGLGTALLKKLIACSKVPTIRLSNIDAAAILARRFAQSLGLASGPCQYEMLKAL